MAGPQSIAGSVAGLLTIAGTIMIEGCTFISTARQRSPELEQLLTETIRLNAVLERIRVLENEFGAAQPTDIQKDGLSDIITPAIIAEGKTLLQSVQSSIRSCQRQPEQHSNKREVQGTLDRFRQLANTLVQAVEVISRWVNLVLLLLLINSVY